MILQVYRPKSVGGGGGGSGGFSVAGAVGTGNASISIGSSGGAAEMAALSI